MNDVKTAAFLIERLQALAKENADKTLFVEGSRRTTRKEFLDTAYRVNAGIRERGIRGKFVVIVLPNSADYLAAEIGIWMSGNASVHLGDSFPEARIRQIVEECEAPMTIDRALIESLKQCAPDAAMADRTPEQDCAMFYTSGSTGKPKGVLHSDFGYMSGLQRLLECMLYEEEDVCGSIAPFYFIAVVVVLKAIYSGSTVDIIDRRTAIDVAAFAKHIIEHNVTVGFTSPSLASALNLSELPIRQLSLGSERVANVAPTPNCKLFNVYGQTEQAGRTLVFHIDKAYENTPLGKPLSGLEAVIVDEQGKEVPQGEEGELCFKNLPPCKYYKDPERTAELMRGGIFHTGDIFRQLPSGDLLYVNRKDWMVKINGQRVEPGEVEAAMRKVDGIAGAVVKGFESEVNHSQYLCAYYIPNGEITEEEIKLALEKTLPEYMVPSYFVRMDKFPLNANGKLDRKSLQAPAAESLQAEYVAPSNEVEGAICAAFEKVLKVEKIGVDDDFFRLGGDSLKLMSIQRVCPSLPISTKMVFDGHTPRNIAALLEDNQEADPTLQEDLPDYPSNRTIDKFYRMSRAMGLLSSAAYHIPALFKLGEGTDLQALCTAIEATIVAHPSMRMKLIRRKDGQLRLVDEKEYTYVQEIEKMSDSQFGRIRKKLIQPFKLLGSWLFRIRVIRTDSGKYLFVDLHHLISDGVSVEIFIDDISRAYNGEKVQSEESTIFKLNVKNERLLGSDVYKKAQKWFAEEFRDSRRKTVLAPDLAIFGKGITLPFFRKTDRKLNIPSQSEMEAFCERENISPNVVFMSAVALVVGHCGGFNEALLSTSFHGRTDKSVQQTIGFIAKPRYMRFHWHDGMKTAEYLQQSKNHILNNLSYDIYPTSAIAKECGISSKMVMCMYQGKMFNAVPRLGGEVATNLHLPGLYSSVSVSFYLFDREDGGYDISLISVKNLYSKRFVEKLVSTFENVVNQMMRVTNLSDIEY